MNVDVLMLCTGHQNLLSIPGFKKIRSKIIHLLCKEIIPFTTFEKLWPCAPDVDAVSSLIFLTVNPWDGSSRSIVQLCECIHCSLILAVLCTYHVHVFYCAQNMYMCIVGVLYSGFMQY